jgi:tetratricopeptide (TPR) repeat protein
MQNDMKGNSKIILLFLIALLFLPLEGMSQSDEYLFRAFYERVEKNMEEGNFEEAMKEIRRAIQMDPKRAESYFYLGRLLLEIQYFPEAIEAFKTSTELDSTSLPAYQNLGIAYYRQKDLGQAIKTLEEAKRRFHDRLDKITHYNLGIFYQDAIMDSDAEKEFLLVLEIDSSDADAHSNLGYSYLRQGKSEDAIEHLALAREFNPERYSKETMLGAAYYQVVQYEEAQKVFKEVLKEDPKNTTVHLHLGLIHLHQVEYDEAIRSFKRVLGVEPTHKEASYNLGLAFARLGRQKKAIQAFEKTIQFHPGHVGAHYNLARLYIKLGKKEEGKKLLKTFEKLSILDEKIQNLVFRLPFKNTVDPELFLDLGDLYLKAMQYPEALNSYQTALSLSPMIPKANYGVGSAYYFQGKNRKAIESFEKTLRLDSTHAPSHYGIALCQIEEKEEGNALRNLKRAVELDSTLPEPHLILAEIYGKRGLSEDQKKEMEIYRKLKENNKKPEEK